MFTRSLSIAAAVSVVGVSLLGAVADAAPNKKLKGAVRIDGSSTVYPITEAVAEEFAGHAPKVRVTVGISGTGGGFKRFVKGETDISDASRPIKAKEYKAAKKAGVEFIEIPVAYDGLSIVVNKDNYWAENLTVDELKMIFLDGSKVRTWNDIRSEWPEVPVKIFSPGVDSGTFDYFKEVVAGKKGSIRSDMSVSEDDNVLVRGVSGNPGGIGFFGCAYYFENADKLKVLAIDGGKGPVIPTPTTIENGSYAPFSRPLFIYVSRNSADRPEVDEFVDFYLDHGADLAAEVGYVALPRMIQDRARRNWNSRRTGTQFLDSYGEKIHGPVTKVYK